MQKVENYLNMLPETITIKRGSCQCPKCKHSFKEFETHYRFYLFRKDNKWRLMYKDPSTWYEVKYSSTGKTPEEAGMKMYKYLKRFKGIIWK